MATPEENKKDYPQLHLDCQLCFPLYAASRKIVNSYTPYLKPLGLTYTQYLVLLALWESGSASVGELCHRLYLDNGTVTPLLKKMEEAELVKRCRSKEDERIVTVTVTEKGWELREKAKNIPFQVGSCMPLSQSEAETLYRLIHTFLEKIDDSGSN
jgi:DNA-binding MarR family transcriptional regulator